MKLRFANQQELTHWNHLILSNPDRGNVFQGLEFAGQKKMGGWTPRFIVSEDVAITVLEKHIFGLGKFWYMPKGPAVTSVRKLDDLLPELKVFSQENGVFAIKIEPELIKKDETLVDLLKLGLVKVRPVQPNASTVLLDLTSSLDEILKNLNQKGRHAIRRAERDGVTVQQVDTTDENCRIMYNLLAQTAAGSFRIRTYRYYQSFWQRYSKAGLGQLFFASVDGQIIAGAYAIAFGKKGTYKDGASVRERPVYGASHLLQWHVIQWMKEKGVTVHDLCGTPPSDQITNPEHSHYGLGRFKTSFNKEVTDYIGAYDVAINPFAYTIWRKIGERIALRLHTMLHHENWY